MKAFKSLQSLGYRSFSSSHHQHRSFGTLLLKNSSFIHSKHLNLLNTYHSTNLSSHVSRFDDCRSFSYTRRGNQYWKEFKNHRKFFDEVEKRMNLKSWEDWYQIKFSDVEFHGGAPLLFEYYGNSLVKALLKIYPERQWKPWRFSSVPHGFWRDTIQQRNFMDEFGRDYKVTCFDDWYTIEQDKILERGANNLLQEFGYSLPRAIINIYPHHIWDASRFADSKKLTQADIDELNTLSKRLNEEWSKNPTPLPQFYDPSTIKPSEPIIEKQPEYVSQPPTIPADSILHSISPSFGKPPARVISSAAALAASQSSYTTSSTQTSSPTPSSSTSPASSEQNNNTASLSASSLSKSSPITKASSIADGSSEIEPDDEVLTVYEKPKNQKYYAMETPFTEEDYNVKVDPATGKTIT